MPFGSRAPRSSVTCDTKGLASKPIRDFASASRSPETSAASSGGMSEAPALDGDGAASCAVHGGAVAVFAVVVASDLG